MSDQDIKKIYDSFVDSGDLKTMFPELTGEWTKDEKTFSKKYRSNEQSLELLFLEDEDDLDFY